MRTEEHRPIRLQDYRPPDWLIETVDLDVSLHPTATTVRARLKLKPNSAGTPALLGFIVSLVRTVVAVGCSETSRWTVSISQSGGR